jgi:Glycosyl transferase family 2
MRTPIPRSAQGKGRVREGSGSPAFGNTPENLRPLGIATKRGPEAAPVKVSNLMCAYKEERTIVRAVGEVLTGSYPFGIELIVIDDCSTEATRTLLALSGDPRVIMHRHQRVLGGRGVLRSAISLTNGTQILPFGVGLDHSELRRCGSPSGRPQPARSWVMAFPATARTNEFNTA